MANRALLHLLNKFPQLPTPVLIVAKVVFCIVPIAQIAMGAVHLNDCPRQRNVPVYLIVVGVFLVLLVLSVCLPCARRPKDGPPNPICRFCLGWNALLSFLLLCWFVAGNVWIYSIYKPNYSKNASDVGSYCNKELYLFAFWTTTMVYILIGLSVGLSFLLLVYYFICGQPDFDDYV
ncbi:transmembrane protein 272-like [Stigmatopora argus]